jgi:uncharacterized protein (TIGR02145 family)
LTNYLRDNNYGFLGTGDDFARAISDTCPDWWISSNQDFGTPGASYGNFNYSGFSARGCGSRDGSDATFNGEKEITYWWTSTGGFNGTYRMMYYQDSIITTGQSQRNFGASIRCVKN